MFFFIIRSFHKNVIDKWTATRYLENVIINFNSIIILDNVWFSQMGDLKKMCTRYASYKKKIPFE